MDNNLTKNLSIQPLNLFLLLAVCGFFACTSPQKLRYFNNLSDSQLVQLPQIKRPEPVIMPDDQLEIKITGSNEATAATINGLIGAPSANYIPLYLVDFYGNIEFPLVGKVKAGGLTREELKISITEKVAKYLKEPMVTIRFSNFRFAILGEVNAPGTYVVQNDKVTVLEALGFARDMTQYARRTNVRVIRDSSGTRHIGMLDFNSKDVFTSPYYYLQRGDVVYIEPEKNKGQLDQANRIGSIVATLASLVAISLTIFK